jgi:hypothetical protein
VFKLDILIKFSLNIQPIAETVMKKPGGQILENLKKLKPDLGWIFLKHEIHLKSKQFLRIWTLWTSNNAPFPKIIVTEQTFKRDYITETVMPR